MRTLMRGFACVCILMMCALPLFGGERTGPSPKELADVTFKVTIPLEEVYQKVLQALEKMKGAGSSTTGAIVTQADPDAMFRGLYNSSYQSTVDLPLTRYVLGYATVDVEKLTEVFKKYMEIVNPAQTVLRQGERTQMFDLRWQKISKAMEELSPLVNDFLKEAQKGFFTIVTLIPLGLLFIMFAAQLVSIGWTNLIKPHLSMRVSVLSILPRFLVFFIFMLVYRQVVAWCITFSNYASIAIVPLDMQEEIFTGIIQSLNTTLTGGSGIMSWVASTMRSLGYIAIKILFVARDVFLAVSVLMGGVCIALGFFTTYDHSDPIHEYLTGWMQGFVKLLFWGPFAAIAVVGMGIVTIISTTGAMSATAVAVASLAFLYAAGNIPNLAERMSGLALQGLLLATAPMMSQVMGTTGRAGGAVGGMLIGARLRNAVSSMVDKIGGGSSFSSDKSSEHIIVDTGAKDYANANEGRPSSTDGSQITQDAKRIAPVPIPRTLLNTEEQKEDDVPTPEGSGVSNVRKPGEQGNTSMAPNGIVADDINESQDSGIISVRNIESSSPDKPPLTLMQQRQRKADILRVLKKMPGYASDMATWSLDDLEKKIAAVEKSSGQGTRPGA